MSATNRSYRHATTIAAAFAVAINLFACGDDSDVDRNPGAGTGGSGGTNTGTGGTGTGNSGTGGSGNLPTPTALCDGLVTDTSPHPMTAVDEPAPGDAYTDPEFNTTIRRITDAGNGEAIVPMYSTIQAWNADESLLILYEVGVGHQLYDGHTYQHIRSLDISPADLEQVYWHTSDPDILYYVNGTRLIRYHATSGDQEEVTQFDFCNGGASGGDDPMYISWDSNVLGLGCGGQIFSYHIGNNAVGGPASAGGNGLSPQASASGQRLFFGGTVLDLQMNELLTLDLGNAYEHASLGRLADGTDIYAGVAYDPGSVDNVGVLVVHSMVDGTWRQIVGESTGYPYPPSGVHVSAIAYKNPGWIFLSIIGNQSGQNLLHNELVLADANPGGVVCRIGHHHSSGDSYWSEPHVAASPSGTRAIFGSDWGGGNSVDTFVVELPSYVAP